MATQTITASDISGETGAETVTFAVGSEWFEVDLTKDEQMELLKALRPYQTAGRKANTTHRRASNPKRFVPDTTAEEREEIRSWAKANGFELAERGKIPNKIYNAYIAAKNGN